MNSTPFYATPIRSTSVPAPQIARYIALVWLALGVLAVICVPALRGRSEWIGVLPFWLIAMPLTNLLILRGRNLLGALHTPLATLRARPAVAMHSVSRAARRSRAAPRRPAPNPLGSLVAGIFR